jgi:hypothetical protein
MKWKVLFLLAIPLMLVSCASNPVSRNVEVFSGDRKSSLCNTAETDKIVRFLDILGHYSVSDDPLPSKTPDYIIKIQPVDRAGRSMEYNIWIKDDKIILQPPEMEQGPAAKPGVSEYPAKDFLQLLKKG